MYLLNTYKKNNLVYATVIRGYGYGIVYSVGAINTTRKLRESALDISEIEMQIDLGIFRKLPKYETVSSSVT